MWVNPLTVSHRRRFRLLPRSSAGCERPSSAEWSLFIWNPPQFITQPSTINGAMAAASSLMPSSDAISRYVALTSRKYSMARCGEGRQEARSNHSDTLVRRCLAT